MDLISTVITARHFGACNMKTSMITLLVFTVLTAGLAPATAKTGDGSSRSKKYAQNDGRYNFKKQADIGKFWRDQATYLSP